MKIKMEFQLPEERMEAEIAQKGGELRSAFAELLDDCRAILKYGDVDADGFISRDGGPYHGKTLEKFRSRVWEILAERNLDHLFQ